VEWHIATSDIYTHKLYHTAHSQQLRLQARHVLVEKGKHTRGLHGSEYCQDLNGCVAGGCHLQQEEGNSDNGQGTSTKTVDVGTSNDNSMATLFLAAAATSRTTSTASRTAAATAMVTLVTLALGGTSRMGIIGLPRMLGKGAWAVYDTM
jgi:hypothetical protein